MSEPDEEAAREFGFSRSRGGTPEYTGIYECENCGREVEKYTIWKHQRIQPPECAGCGQENAIFRCIDGPHPVKEPWSVPGMGAR